MDGDRVGAELVEFRGKKEAVITQIIERKQKVVIGTLQLGKDFAFVIPDHKNFIKDVYISKKHLSPFSSLLNHTKVWVKILSWDGKNPSGSIVEVFPKHPTLFDEVSMLALENGWKTKFPKFILEESEKKFEISREGRVDLTQKMFYTIDGDDAKDLDDAIYLEKRWEDFVLFVSIADVSAYVIEGSVMDKEALKRGNSTYLVDRVIPMLPERLSNDLCSLNPHTQKMTLTAEITLDKNGNILSKKVYESVIQTRFRLTYREVQEMIDGTKCIWDELLFWGIVSKELRENIEYAHILKKKIEKKNQEKWVLDFDFDEIKVKLDQEGKPVSVEKYHRYESMKIIEVCMILANQCVWELFAKIPFLYRIHPLPSDEDIEILQKNFALFGVEFSPKHISPKYFAQILETISSHPQKQILQSLVLRSLSKAIYSPENQGHFWLNLEFYSHFTSPIRRYSDLMAHRIIKDFLHTKNTTHLKQKYEPILWEIAKKISQTERLSEKFEYKIRDFYICHAYQDKIWNIYRVKITGMIEFGCFVELENWVEGFVWFDQIAKVLGKKSWVFVKEFMRCDFGKDFFVQLWENLEVQLTQIDFEKLRLNFDFLKKIIQ